MICWNVNRWPTRKEAKYQFLISVINKFNADITCLCETWLRETNAIVYEGYTWIGQNRCKIAKKAVRGSGGVGMLVKHNVYNKFKVNVVDTSYEGILWVKFEHRENPPVTLLVCVCYLPPSRSSRGDTSLEVFENLGNQYLLYSNLGPVCICGDLNARCGDHHMICSVVLK